MAKGGFRFFRFSLQSSFERLITQYHHLSNSGPIACDDDTMDRQLESPILITPVGSAKKLSASDTYGQINSFIINLPFSPARTQLERLADALGVETGNIAPSEGDRREAGRREEKALARAERRKKKEEERALEEKAEMEAAVEGLEGEEREEGGAEFEDEQDINDRGDVEYGDDVEDDDDEPDNEQRMEVDEGKEEE